MDTSQIKNVVQKLGFLRNYSSLFVPLIIVIAGALLFIPTRLMSSRLKAQMAKESISVGKRVETLSRSIVARDQWDVEREYQQIYANDVNQMMLLAKQSSQRQLLSYQIFPKPKDTSTLIFKGFGQAYRTGIEQMLERVTARDCPSQAEVERSLQASTLGGTGIVKRFDSLQRLGEVDAAIVNELCSDRAKSVSFYANPADLSGYAFWETYEYTGMTDATEDCWYWQLGYWIIEDVVDTIAATNSQSENVLTAPAKRLMHLSFTPGATDVIVTGKTRKPGKEQNRPSYAQSDGGYLAEPLTGRYSNDDVDIVHFTFTVVIDAKEVLPFIQQLCSAKQHKFTGFTGGEEEQVFKHNQITVLESNISTIYRDSDTHNLYRYGEDAVVEMELICEYIFNRSGYDEVKPDSVKKSARKGPSD
jgi:hypothetical protein